MVFKAGSRVSPLLTADTGKVGVRLSSHPIATGLARRAGVAITGTSANISGEPPCADAEDVLNAVGKEVDLILDAGKTPGEKGSTVLDMTVEEALRKLDQDLHDAFVANMYQVRVVHGKGTGILKNAVQEYLSHSSLVSSYRLAGYGEGGGGVTIVDLAPE